jgi:SMC interacting uncharacterized protein involved in chromosome segregation
MKELRTGIAKLAEDELIRANGMHPMFQSQYHGHGVLKEEIEECEEALDLLKSYEDELWYDIRRDKEASIEFLNNMGNQAIEMACEAIQVVAMVKKYINSMEDKVYE